VTTSPVRVELLRILCLVVFALALQFVGLLILAAGLWMLTPWLGIAVLGAGTLLAGVALEADRPAGNEH